MNIEFENGSMINGIKSESAIRGARSKIFIPKWCHVCDNKWDDHLLLLCDGETCTYCQDKWDECECGR